MDDTFQDFPYGARHTLRYDEPAPLTLIETELFAVHLLFSAALPFISPRARSTTLRSFCFLRIDSASPCALSALLPVVGRLRSLLSFATSTQNAVTFLGAFAERDDAESLPKRVDPKRRLEFLPVDDPDDSATGSDVLYPHHMLFTLGDDQAQSLRATRAWLEAWPRIGPLIQLFLGATQASDLYQEHAFLSLVQALEGFHRITSSNQIVPRAQHRERMKRIVHSVDAADRDFVCKALQYSNEPSLRQRLESLLNLGLATAPDFMGQPAEFLKRTVATRHYFSHFAPGLRAKAAGSLEIYGIVFVLRALFEMVTLLHFGWSESAVREVIGRCLENRPTRG